MSAPDEIPASAPSLVTPGLNQGINPIIVDDIVPPRYPEGCNLTFQRPNELGVVFTTQLPVGCMVLLLLPEDAQHVRPIMKALQQRQRAAVAKNGLGHGG